MRECGTCSLCCKVLNISELGKPRDVWCSFCKPGRGGCTVYATRPEVCIKFQCQWLTGDVEDIWKPIDSKMVLNVSKLTDQFMCMEVVVDSGFPNRWREPVYYSRLKIMAEVGLEHNVLVRVQSGGNSWFVLSNKDVEIPKHATGFTILKTLLGKFNIEFNFIGEKSNVDDTESPSLSG